MRLRPVLALCALAPLVALAAAPYAKTPEVPKGLEDREEWVELLKGIQKQVPPRDAIAIPPYPGAVVTYFTEGEKHNVLQLVTTDPREKVTAHYKKVLSDWNYAEKMMNPCFFKGPVESFQPLMPDEQKLPYLVLVPVLEGGTDTDLVPGAKTRLQIYFAR